MQKHFSFTNPKIALYTHKVQCVVSPANSYGSMDGGYDAAIIDYFGIQLEKAVQKYILDNFYGEQPVGTSFTIDIPGTEQKLMNMGYDQIKNPSSVVYWS